MLATEWFTRLGLIAAAVLGAGGIAAAAGASHAGDQTILAPLALIALTQSPAIVALSLYGAGRWLQAATAFIALGALLFCADLAFRHILGASPIAFTAPIGGSAMIVGWALLAPAGFFLGR